MPELPEVETILNDLAPRIEGQVFQEIVLKWPGAITGSSPQEFVETLPGSSIERMARRGKYLLLHLAPGQTVIIHLGMTGRLCLLQPGETPDIHCRVLFRLDAGLELSFSDVRKFGHVWLATDPESVVGKLGPEALEIESKVEYLCEKLQGRTANIKALLLDQTLLAGLGNIYVDEALFEAGVHPSRRAGAFSPEDVARLARAIPLVLRRGIRNRGTTFDDYRDGLGRKGNNQQALSVFHRTGAPCPRCGTTIKRIVIAGRGTHFCPRCQKA
ncbi:MAG: bifunctional DNA-formamidopyrimidine glycosylase/DNA-(apurinic or apyrimidinic site) lyase [Dehalococcoidia bacterium]|nr:bifunctional DNA-formamidopyrimidine glycosylase/DNA-(apurinic or apyrimidinic site) lyase [Dehalococcoidia bacterium]